mmetsp:Transcript_590/g.1361  ORF Transcript_590/g.1361 Transcript_590/m.1361 type:complete len:572 (-) Transcript_590:106-1821(-)
MGDMPEAGSAAVRDIQHSDEEMHNMILAVAEGKGLKGEQWERINKHTLKCIERAETAADILRRTSFGKVLEDGTTEEAAVKQAMEAFHAFQEAMADSAFLPESNEPAESMWHSKEKEATFLPPGQWDPRQVGVFTWFFGKSGNESEGHQSSSSITGSGHEQTIVKLRRAVESAEIRIEKTERLLEARMAKVAEGKRFLYAYLNNWKQNVRQLTRMKILSIVSSMDKTSAEAAKALGFLYKRVGGNQSETSTDWTNIHEWDKLDPSSEVIRIIQGGWSGYSEVDMHGDMSISTDCKPEAQYKSLEIMKELLCMPTENIPIALRTHTQRVLIHCKKRREQMDLDMERHVEMTVPEMVCPIVVEVLMHAIRINQRTLHQAFDDLERLRSDPTKMAVRQVIVTLGELAKLGSVPAFEKLKDILRSDDKDWSLQQMAIVELSQLVDVFQERAVKPLLESCFEAEQTHPFVRKAAEDGLVSCLMHRDKAFMNDISRQVTSIISSLNKMSAHKRWESIEQRVAERSASEPKVKELKHHPMTNGMRAHRPGNIESLRVDRTRMTSHAMENQARHLSAPR